MLINKIKKLSRLKQEAFSRIHAHICGDGNLYAYLEKRSPSSVRTGRTNKRFMRYVVEYTNTVPKLLNQFKKDIRLLYGNVYVYRDVDRVIVKRKEPFQDMSLLGCGRSKEWKIPRFIINNGSLRKVWL